MKRAAVACMAAALLGAPLALAQAPDGEGLFRTHCAACHTNPVQADIPTRQTMGTLSPNAIVQSLTEGTMRIQGQPLTPGERTAIAELVTGRRVAAAANRAATAGSPG